LKAVPKFKLSFCAQLAFEMETPPVSWLGGILLGRPSRRGVASSDEAPKQWRAPDFFRLTVAQRRRLHTVFPCTESRCDCGPRNLSS